MCRILEKKVKIYNIIGFEEMSDMKFYSDELTPELLKKAEKELGETEEIRTRSLRELKLLINGEPDFFPCMDDVFLLAFLRVRKFDIQKAFKTLKNYYTNKARYSRYLTDFTPSEIKSFLDQYCGGIYEYRDQDGGAIAMILMALSDIDKFTIEQSIAPVVLVVSSLITNEVTQIAGLSIILDLSEIDWRIAKFYTSPSMIYKVVDYLVGSLPLRIKNYHVINPPLYADIMLSIALRFFPAKHRKRLHVHKKDFKSLHKFISPDILPEEYGGMQGPISTFVKKNMNYILSQEDNYIKYNGYGYKGKTLQTLQNNK